MKKLTDAQVYTLRRMKNHSRYILRGDGKKGDEIRRPARYGHGGDHVNAPSLPVLFRLGLIEFVRGGDKVAGRYYDVQLTVAGLERAVMEKVTGDNTRHATPSPSPSPSPADCECSSIDYCDNCMRKMSAKPAPAVNTKPDFDTWFNSPGAGLRVVNFEIQRKLQLEAWNACRAAMLSQPVSQGYKLPPGYKLAPNEPTESMVICGFGSDAFLSLVNAVNEAKGWPYSCAEAAECVTGIFKEMLAAAPE